MLQPTAAPLGQVQDEQVAVVGQPAEEIACRLDNGLGVVAQPLRILVAVAPDRDAGAGMPSTWNCSSRWLLTSTGQSIRWS